MSNTPEFVAHALDLVESLGGVTARSMFGGHGLYARGVMFGLLDGEELFLRADDVARPTFAEAGCRQWSYPSKKGPVPGDYWRPPDAAHEDAEAMRPWCELALAAALRRAAARAAKEKPRAARATGGKAAGAGGTASTALHRAARARVPARAAAKARAVTKPTAKKAGPARKGKPAGRAAPKAGQRR